MLTINMKSFQFHICVQNVIIPVDTISSCFSDLCLSQVAFRDIHVYLPVEEFILESRVKSIMIRILKQTSGTGRLLALVELKKIRYRDQIGRERMWLVRPHKKPTYKHTT